MKSHFKCPVVIHVKKILRDRKRTRNRRERRKNDFEYREREKKRDRLRIRKMTPEQLEAQRLRKRNYHQKNKEVRNKKRCDLKIKNRERENEVARSYYHRTRETTLRKILSTRRKRDPTIGLYSSIQANRAGNLGDGELIERIEQANQLIDERIKRIKNACR